MRILLLTSIAVLVSACATKVTMTGPSYPPTDPATIKVFATQKPDCNLEELGLVVTNLKWNQEKAVEDAKVNAAKIGATHMQIGNVTRNGFNDAAVAGEPRPPSARFSTFLTSGRAHCGGTAIARAKGLNMEPIAFPIKRSFIRISQDVLANRPSVGHMKHPSEGSFIRKYLFTQPNSRKSIKTAKPYSKFI